MPEDITVVEVGPRDGLQIAGSIMATADKLRWIESLAAAGLRTIEVGSFVPPALVPQMADTGEIVRSVLSRLPGIRVAALVPNLKGAQRAHAAGVHSIVVPVSVSEGHSLANTNKGTFAQVEEFGLIAAWVRAQPRPMETLAACATAFGCSIDGSVPLPRVVKVAVALAEAGADSVALADTVGYADPAAIRATVRAVRGELGARLSTLHMHDTYGLGLANALAGLEEGIRRFDSALGGLGGCPFAPGAAGNIATEDLVYMLESMGLRTGIDLGKLLEARLVLERALPAEPLRGALGRAGIPRVFRDKAEHDPAAQGSNP
ncbi:MAG: hydroxymethylglutaryl-CoA lyase [Rhizobiaceae bacterium]|nr:hydroxymethylglutaryl-CoA lyase [Rhizobiaceae bacterium]